MKNRDFRGIAFLAIMISLIVALIVIYAAITLYTGGKDTKEETITTPIERGRSVQCLAQMRRVEAAIQIYRLENGRYPSALNEVEDLTGDDYYCPVTNNAYYYDPVTGNVTCQDHAR